MTEQRNPSKPPSAASGSKELAAEESTPANAIPERGEEWVTLAVLSKPRGIRGELFALPETSHWERFQAGRQFQLWFPKAASRMPRIAELEEAWSHNGKLILKFAGVDSIEAAGELRSAEVCLRSDEREPLPEGEYYFDELKGFTIVDIKTGEAMGTVAGFTEGIGPGVLEVESTLDAEAAKVGSGAERWQVPFAKEICVDVDLDAREIRVRLPEGLRELNRSERDEG